jgi:hypothetical protein
MNSKTQDVRVENFKRKDIDETVSLKSVEANTDERLAANSDIRFESRANCNAHGAQASIKCRDKVTNSSATSTISFPFIKRHCFSSQEK